MLTLNFNMTQLMRGLTYEGFFHHQIKGTLFLQIQWGCEQELPSDAYTQYYLNAANDKVIYCV